MNRHDIERSKPETPTVPAPRDWRKTPIANWSDGALVREVERIGGPNWWKTDEPRDASNREIIRLVDRSGKKGFIRDGGEESDEHTKRREAGVDDEELRKLLPDDDETIVSYLARLGTIIDFNGPNKILCDGLRGFCARFRGDALARNLDSNVVAAFLKKVIEE